MTHGQKEASSWLNELQLIWLVRLNVIGSISSIHKFCLPFTNTFPSLFTRWIREIIPKTEGNVLSGSWEPAQVSHWIDCVSSTYFISRSHTGGRGLFKLLWPAVSSCFLCELLPYSSFSVFCFAWLCVINGAQNFLLPAGFCCFALYCSFPLMYKQLGSRALSALGHFRKVYERTGWATGGATRQVEAGWKRGSRFARLQSSNRSKTHASYAETFYFPRLNGKFSCRV